MRLSKIKLSGFKSFVDPTTISFPSNLVGVVGPNGCGKSNVIDAVRWVMGESSASRLRGDSMTDVIFNGSSARKPVGTATIELIFDNSDGTLGGQYASFAEISIRRTVARDGLSTYFLNGTKCRRKDITGIFLGTGLGPRSYSIIEQGMISRLIEAKPEDMRVYVEEAAGISRYKERRRETENRIRHTRENLERLTDLLEEVEKQIKHLDRQARTAERYKKLKAEERRKTAELVLLKLAELDRLAGEHQRRLADCENRFQAAVAEQRRVEAAIEAARERHGERTEQFNEVQATYYKVGAEIARLEQAIEHGEELRERQAADLEQAREGARDVLAHIDQDTTTLQELELALNELAPGLAAAREREAKSGESLQRAEAAMNDWRERWEQFQHDANEAERRIDVEAARIEEYENLHRQQGERRERIADAQSGISIDEQRLAIESLGADLARCSAAAERADTEVAELRTKTDATRERERRHSRHLDDLNSRLQTTLGRYSAAQALQRAALGADNAGMSAWLGEHGLAGRGRLLGQLNVRAGWERAVETVLGGQLQAISVASLDDLAEPLRALNGSQATFMQATQPVGAGSEGTLAGVVDGAPVAVRERLGRVRLAESVEAALALRRELTGDESVVTRCGAWVSREFLSVNRAEDSSDSVLRREQELRNLTSLMKEQRQGVADEEAALARARQELAELEQAYDTASQAAAECHRKQAEAQAQRDNAAYRLKQMEEQLAAYRSDGRSIDEERQLTAQRIGESRTRQREARETIQQLGDKRAALEAQRAELSADLDRVSAQAREDRDAAQDLAIRYESQRTSKDSASQSLARMQSQLAQFRRREQDLAGQIASSEAPLGEKRTRLEAELARRVDVEEALSLARTRLDEMDAALRRLEQERMDAETAVTEQREAQSEARMAAQETRVRRESLAEQFDGQRFNMDELRAELDGEATIETWEESLAKLTRRIERLGPINLAAIDEYKEQSERKEYLDSQLKDLGDALETLENAIRKIDRETRARFKETFDKIDAGFKRLFPRLFGGGHAYLELTGDDLLTSGVTVMARPPGKRNSTIHLLSGGEKALTAVALVFAIFELNPAPFCMLDEVDAPLDDANVGRYCEIVKSMAETVQFVFITHNKVTMEMARQLTGVTMQEPGVSRLVTVDLDEAAKLAAS